MKVKNIKECLHGWFIGNFDDSILKTEDFEVAYMKWKKGPFPDLHFQRVATEYNFIIRGSCTVNGVKYREGDFFMFEPYVVNEGGWDEPSECIVVKTPSIPSDKQVVELKCK